MNHYPLCQDLVALRSSRARVPNLRYGNPELSERFRAVSCSDGAVVRVRYQGNVPVEVRDGDSDECQSYYLLKGSTGQAEVCWERPLPGGRTARIALRDLYTEEPRVLANREYQWWSSLQLSKMLLPGDLITDILSVKLLEEECLPVHGGAVLTGGEGALIIGPPDIGKTFTTMRLVRNGASFLAEDMCIVRGETVYGLPYTETVGKRDPALSLSERLKTGLVDALFKGNARKSSVLETLEDGLASFVPSARVGGVYLLARGEEDVARLSGQKAYDRVCQLNELELSYGRNLALLWYAYLNPGPEMLDYQTTERRLIAELLESCPVYRVRAPKPERFAHLIGGHLDD